MAPFAEFVHLLEGQVLLVRVDIKLQLLEELPQGLDGFFRRFQFAYVQSVDDCFFSFVVVSQSDCISVRI
jgi:hypothetical protein